MTAIATYHPSGIAEAGRHSALRIASAAMGHPSWGQTYPMPYPDGGNRSYCYRPLFKRIRRRFAVFPENGIRGMVWQIRSPTAKNQKALFARAGANAVSDFLAKTDAVIVINS